MLLSPTVCRNTISSAAHHRQETGSKYPVVLINPTWGMSTMPGCIHHRRWHRRAITTWALERRRGRVTTWSACAKVQHQTHLFYCRWLRRRHAGRWTRSRWLSSLQMSAWWSDTRDVSANQKWLSCIVTDLRGHFATDPKVLFGAKYMINIGRKLLLFKFAILF